MKILIKTKSYSKTWPWSFRLIAAIFTSLMLVLIARAELGRDTGMADQVDLLTVNTAKLVTETGYTLSRRFTGQVEATQTSAIGFELAGRVNAINADEGDIIKQGQLLAQLDTERLLAKRNELIAQLKEIETQAKLASTTVDRLTRALEYDGVTPQQLDEGQQRLDSARANIDVIRSSINSIDTDIEKSKLIAPYNATVTRRHIDLGQVIPSGSPVLTLQKQANAEARVGVASELLKNLTVAENVDIELEGQTTQATIRSILPVRNNVTRVVDVILDINDSNARPGDLVNMIIHRDIQQSGYWIPISALEEGERGLWTLFLAEPDEQGKSYALRRHFIEIVHQESNRVFISEFDHQDHAFVVDGLQRVVAGQLVNIETQQQNVVTGLRP